MRILFFAVVLLFILQDNFYSQNANLLKAAWTVNPFDNKGFEKNSGQFDDIPSKAKILYGARLGNMFLYFTNHGILYRSVEWKNPPREDEESKSKREEEEEREQRAKPEVHQLTAEWIGANPEVELSATEMKQSYVSYTTKKNKTIRAELFTKLTYYNLYPGIDAVYEFQAGKEGLKYSLIVHPGAVVMQARLKYSGEKNIRLNLNGDVIIKSGCGEFTDHAPVSFEAGSKKYISTGYKLIRSELTFSLNEKYDKTKLLIIDPWQTNPSFSGASGVFSVDYDSKGNVFAYGGQTNNWQLVKLNNAGVIQWSFTPAGQGSGCYANCCVDDNGNCYVSAGNGSSGVNNTILKINSAGTQVGSYTIPLVTGGVFPTGAEVFRMKYNSCYHAVVIGGGAGAQLTVLDTNMATAASLPGAIGPDVALLAVDPSYSSYYFLNASGLGSFQKMPMGSFTPIFNVGKGFVFSELNMYYTFKNAGGQTNGMSGMGASYNWVYTYDSYTLSRCSNSTGATVSTYSIAPVKTIYGSKYITWGGLAVDACTDKSYVGFQKSILVFDSAFSTPSTIALTDTVFDVTLDKANSKLYASGLAYVTSMDITTPSAQANLTTSTSSTPASCTCNGTASTQPTFLTCGKAVTGNYTYLWSDGQTTATATGLCAGNYTVTVTSCGNLSVIDSVSIGSSSGLGITLSSVNNPLCNGYATGSATVKASGGTAAYTYLWSNSQTGSTVTGLSAADYTVTVTDASAACSSTSIVSITQPPAFTITGITTTNTDCGQATGTAIANVAGGTGLYTFVWSNASSGQTGTGFSFGSFSVTVTDANNCIQTSNGFIGSNGPPGITTIQPTAVLCNGGSSGSAVVTASGTGIFTYSWSNGQTSITATNLSAKAYSVTVSDAGGCSATGTITIAEPTAISIVNSSTVATNCGSADGSAVVSASGGTGALTYNWSNLQTGPTAANLSAATYTLTVTDASGCTITNSITINSSNGPNVTTTISSPVNCNGQTGSVTAITSNGIAPYTYNWSNGTSSVTTSLQSTIVNQQSAIYIVTITDANGCSTVSTTVLTQPAPLTVTAVGQPASCGGINGTASAVAGGGTVSYTYSWNSALGGSASGSIVNGLIASDYTVQVTDANGCTASTSVTISSSNPPVADIGTLQSEITQGNSTVLIGSGGTNYTWTPAVSLSCYTCSMPIANPLTTTTYTLYVTDDYGCADSSVITIKVKTSCSGDNDIYIANIFSPNGDGKNDVLNIEGNGLSNIYWSIYDRWGNMVFETTDQSQGWDGTKNGSETGTGTYVYYLKATCIKTNTEVKIKGNVSVVK